ncbi:hypothetical protein FDP41_004703 [Naegleria fowleri]|uniref:Uncharacterized protein n=1 Tax=Naegleria fowleri TaxID=5763 RepID=A0A6A5BMV9_NAEFO|nr:uncharacterized protein FDP41_005651 [Naegleria fowleri]XP_044560740.1 uncharacterized protein FDP41_004703 [Naegleria fowleri]KAF0975320.1 hypothetical protein FDP41_005651 [Naegleria fowleri]KAF0976027.1 hypothetical protein FDP41_004703 [Naegleria fowleri]
MYLQAISSGAVVSGKSLVDASDSVTTFAVTLSTSITSDVLFQAAVSYGGTNITDTKMVRVNNKQASEESRLYRHMDWKTGCPEATGQHRM